MLCKNCGSKIEKKDRRPDGLYRCPQCGKLYRVKRSSGTGKRGRRRRLRWPALAAVAAVIVVAAALLAFLARDAAPDEQVAARPAPDAAATQTAEAARTAAPSPTPAPTHAPAASVHFRAVGDIMVHKLQLKHARQSDGSYNFDSQFMYVKDSLSNADYTIANLETSISADGEYSSYPRFRTPETLLATLKDCGVDMLTLANNHILDGLFPGVVATLDAADRYGFDHVGAYRTPEAAQQPKIVEINGIRFGFLAYTAYLNENERYLDGNQLMCLKRFEDADFAADVRELRELGAEVVICLPHWGEEESHAPNAQCKQYARELIDAGVDIILGSHSHVVQPIEKYQVEVDGEQKEVLVAWSLGNFISFMDARYMDCGIILDFTVTRDESGKISVHDLGYVPVYVCGTTNVFHLVCSGEFYDEKPSGMPESEYDRMRQSAREIISAVGTDGIEVLRT